MCLQDSAFCPKFAPQGAGEAERGDGEMDLKLSV